MAWFVRKFTAQDKAAIRRLSCETAFFDLPREAIFNDDEILADFLTLYFTDYEAGSCFVAVDNGDVVGYLIGSKNTAMMKKAINSEIVPALTAKIFRRKTLFSKTNIRFLLYCLLSLVKGEFFMKNFSKEYPATLHININKAYRKQGIGRKLIETYLSFLQECGVKGVYLSTISENARTFFLKLGFDILCVKKRSYLKLLTAREVNLYVLGKRL